EYRDFLTVLTNKDDRDDGEEAQYLELPGRIERQQASLEALQAAERALSSQKSPTPRDTSGHAIRVIDKKVDPRDHIVRAMLCHFVSKMSGKPLFDVLRERFNGEAGTE